MRTPAADITQTLNNVNARLSTRKSGIFNFFFSSFGRWPVLASRWNLGWWPWPLRFMHAGIIWDFLHQGQCVVSSLPLNGPRPWLASLVGIRAEILACDLAWATGDFWSVATFGAPGDICSWHAGEVWVLFFFLLYYGAILIPDVRLGLPNGLFSLPVWGHLFVCLFVCLSVCLWQ